MSTLTSTVVSEKEVNLEGLKLNGQCVLVEPFEVHEVGGIIIPESAKESTQDGIVSMVGPGDRLCGENWDFPDRKTRDNMTVKEGDKICHGKYAGVEVKIEGKKYRIMKEDEILGIYQDGPEWIKAIRGHIFIDWEYALAEYKGTNILCAPGTAKERHFTGIVVSVSDTVEEVSIGDRVFFDQFCRPKKIVQGDKRFLFLYEGSIFCTLPKRMSIEGCDEVGEVEQ